MRLCHVSLLLNRMMLKYPNFVFHLYCELTSEANRDKDYKLISNIQYMRFSELISKLESKHNIKIWGHKEVWNGNVLTIQDIKTVLTYEMSEKFVLIFPMLLEMINNGILKPMNEWGCDS